MNQAIEHDNYLINTYACEASNNDESMPAYIFDDEGNRAFKLKYVRSDGWCGYWETDPVKKWGWEKVDSDWVTGDYDDAGRHGETETAERFKKLADKLAKEGKKLLVVFAPTSNVFSTGYDVYTKKTGGR